MILRDISLYLNVDEYDRAYGSDFGFRSRYLCNYVRRHIVPLKFRTNGFRSISVEGRSIPEEACPILGENAAVASVRFDRQRYDSLDRSECHEFFIDMLERGLAKCSQHHDIPLAQMMSTIEAFRVGGYRNEWTHKRKLLRPVGLRAVLDCSLDMDRFVLTLKLERRGELVYEAPILETKPDEIIFAHRFKDIVLDGRTLVITNKFDKPTHTLDLDVL